MNVHHPSDGLYGHRLTKHDDDRLEQQSESAFRSAPGHSHGLDTASKAVNAGNRRVKKRSMFEEVQMTPLSRFGVIHLGGCSAFGAGKLTSPGIIEMDVMLPGFNIKIDLDNLVRWLQSKRGGEKCVFMVHFDVFPWVR